MTARSEKLAFRAPQRILIVKPSALGDIVTAMPVLRGIARSFPQAKVSWLVNTNCAEIIQDDPDLDDVILFDRKLLGRAWRSAAALRELTRLLGKLRKGRFDWVIDLQGLLRSGLLTAVTTAPVRVGFDNAREGASLFYTHKVSSQATHVIDRNIELATFLGIDATPADFTLHVSQEAKALAADLLRRLGLGGKGFILAFPPTRWPTKIYPVRHWRTVVAEMSRFLPVILMGAPGDRPMCEEIASGAAEFAGLGIEKNRGTVADSPSRIIDLAGQTSVSQMVALVQASAGVICSDSAAKFIAPAVGVNVVTLLGPTRMELTGPYVPGPSVKARAIVSPAPCHGCLKKRCSHMTCMEMIPPQEVIRAAKELFVPAGI